MDTTGTETVLYNFTGADGANPYAGLIRDSAGNLHGTTFGGGGWGAGVVFKLDTTGTETVLHTSREERTGRALGSSDPRLGYSGSPALQRSSNSVTDWGPLCCTKDFSGPLCL